MSAAINRLWGNRWPIVAAAIVTFAFVLLGGLPLVLATTGFAVVCVVMLIANRPASLPSSNTFPQPAASETDWQQLQVIIDALPDPVVALDSTLNLYLPPSIGDRRVGIWLRVLNVGRVGS